MDAPAGKYGPLKRQGENFVFANGKGLRFWGVNLVASANFPMIRLFTVKKKVSDTPLDDVEGSWQLCSPESVSKFSAVGYFFSRDLHQRCANQRTGT